LAKCNSTTEPVGAISPACGSVLEDRADGCGVRRSDERSVAAYAVCRLTSGTLATIRRRRRDPGGRRPRAADAARPDKHAEHRPRLGAQGDSRRPGSGGRHHARQRVHGQLQRLRRVEDRERVPAVPDRPVSIPGADPAQPAGLAFTVYVVPSDEPVGKVVAQEPNSGTAVAVGLAVRFNTFRAADDGLLEQRVVRGFTRGNRIGPELPSGRDQAEHERSDEPLVGREMPDHAGRDHYRGRDLRAQRGAGRSAHCCRRSERRRAAVVHAANARPIPSPTGT